MLTGFRDPELLRQALRHRSAGKPNNERLEFLGDVILGLLVSDALYRKFPKASEGELTQARSPGRPKGGPLTGALCVDVRLRNSRVHAK